MKPHGPLAVGNTGHCVTTQHSMNHTHGMLLCSEALLCALSARHTAQLLCTRHPAIRGEPAASTVCVLFLAVLHSRAWRAVGYLTNLVVGRLRNSWPAKLTPQGRPVRSQTSHSCILAVADRMHLAKLQAASQLCPNAVQCNMKATSMDVPAKT